MIPICERFRGSALFLSLLATVFFVAPALGAGADEPAVSVSHRHAAQDYESALGDCLSRLTAAMAKGDLPGAVLVVGDRERTFVELAVGERHVAPDREALTYDTIFDLASLTKPIATSSCVMKLVEQGRLKLDDPVSAVLPEFHRPSQQSVTLRHLLVHTSGLIADNALSDYVGDHAQQRTRILSLEPRTPPGTRFVYSDMGLMVVGEMVAKASGKPLDAAFQELVAQPLGLTETRYLPPEEWRSRIAPTEDVRGIVHDPRARRYGGVAGHAGLFSTATDLAKYARAVLASDRGESDWLTAGTVKLWSTPNEVPLESAKDGSSRKGTRGLGWDIQSPYSGNRPKSMSARSIGHGGFTGTVLWIDLERQTFLIFLSSRLYPDGKGSVNSLAAELGDIVLKAR